MLLLFEMQFDCKWQPKPSKQFLNCIAVGRCSVNVFMSYLLFSSNPYIPLPSATDPGQHTMGQRSVYFGGRGERGSKRGRERGWCPTGWVRRLDRQIEHSQRKASSVFSAAPEVMVWPLRRLESNCKHDLCQKEKQIFLAPASARGWRSPSGMTLSLPLSSRQRSWPATTLGVLPFQVLPLHKRIRGLYGLLCQNMCFTWSCSYSYEKKQW